MIPERIYFIFIALGLLACTPTDRKEPSAANLSGDWVYVNTEPSRKIYNYIGVEFDSATFYRVSDIGRMEVGNFSVTGDSVIVKWENRILDKYKINLLTEDSLRLSEDENEYVYYSRRLDFDKNLLIDSLELDAKDCPEKCPEFKLKLNRKKEVVEFSPLQNCGVEKATEIKFSEKEWNILDSVFMWSKIDAVDTTWSYDAADGWEINIKFHYNNKHIIVRGAEGHHPYRLQPVINLIVGKLEENELI